MTTAINRYELHQRRKGNRESSIRTTRHRLEAWFPGRTVIGNVTPAAVRAAYDARVDAVRPDTHRGELAEVKTFFAWAEREGLVQDNPAAGVDPVGRRSKGKEQLHEGEAMHWLTTAYQMAGEGRQDGLAAVVLLLTGVRASELLERTARDVDAIWRRDPETGEPRRLVTLVIDWGKTANAARRVAVDEPAGQMLLDLVEGLPAGAWLWPSPRSASGHRGKTWLLGAVRRVCRAAGVPRVTPHGIRGTSATIQTEAGLAALDVARQLGHGNARVTREHYIQQQVAPGLRVVRR